MKINPETRHQDLALYVSDHLESLDVKDTKWSITTMVIGMYDLPLFACLLSIFKIEFIWFASPFILFIHVWLIRILVKNVYSTQLEVILYMGCWSLLGAISLSVAFQGMLYYYFHITSVVSHIIIILTTILSVYILVKYQIKKYASDTIKERKESNQYKYTGVLSATPGIAYLFTVITKRIYGLNDVLHIFSIYLFVIFCAYFAAKFLHRYFFMKANMKYVRYQPITAKERKKIKKQGVEIK